MARRRSLPKFKLKESTVYTLSTLLLFLCAVLVWLSFTQKGALLIAVNGFFISNMGLLSTLFLPFTFITGGSWSAVSKPLWPNPMFLLVV